jgi:hypothetical protein
LGIDGFPLVETLREISKLQVGSPAKLNKDNL